MAIKNIRKRKLRSWLTMIGILIGIMSIVALIGLGEGLRVAIAGQFGAFAPDLISVTAGGTGGPPGTSKIDLFTTDDIKKISNLKEIEEAAGRNIKFGKTEFNDKIAFGAVVSMPYGDGRDLIEYAIGIKVDKGRLLKDSDAGKIVIGNNIADEDTFGKKIKIGNKILVNDKSFEIIGILKKQGSFIIDGTIFMNEDDFAELFDTNKGEYALIAARYNDKTYTSDEAVASIEKLMRKARDVNKGEEDFEVSTPQNVIDNLNSSLFAVQLFVYIIAGISILVGGIGIMTTMYTTVVERTKDIGIMKAIGARNETIFWLFFIESGFIGLAGGIAGVILGVGTAYGLAAIGQAALGEGLIQAHITSALIFGSLAFSFILGSLFGTFPALGAAKMHPVDALRHTK